MTNRKLFNSKNIVHLIENLLDSGKEDLVMQILKQKELKSLTPNILNLLKKKNLKLEDYNTTKIFSKTEIKKEVLENLMKSLGLEISNDGGSTKIIIDESMSAGIRIKSKNRLLDATLSTMLQKGVEELIN